MSIDSKIVIVKVMEMNGNRNDYAFKKAIELAQDVDIEPINYPENSSFDEKQEGEEILLLKEIASNEDMPEDARKSAASALMFSLSPLEKLKDKLPIKNRKAKKNTIVSKVFSKAINKIKNDPEKTMQIVDNLPPGLKKFGMKTFGIVGGAVVGAKMGAMAGSFAGDYLGENQLSEVYKNLKKMNEELVEKEKQLRETLIQTAKNYLSSQISKFIKISFSNKYRRSLEILLLYLFSIMFSVSPIFGKRISSYIAALLMAASIALFLIGVIRTTRSLFPYVRSIYKEKSVVNGVLVELKKLNESFAKGEKLIQSMNITLTDRELMPLVKEVLRLFKKQIIIYIVGFIMITMGFFLIKHGVILQTTELSALQIILYPFFALK